MAAGQMINKDGAFYKSTVENLLSSNAKQHAPCTVVSIVGPQHGGKSTLLNKTFHTNFVMSNGQTVERTTEGIWIARGRDPNMILMDVEGSDSNQREEEGAGFEQKVTLFCLAASDVMILNMKKDNLGQHHGGSGPLLTAIFRECVKLKEMKKTTLLVTLRDCHPMLDQDNLNAQIHSHMTEIWKKAHPGSHKSFHDYILLYAIAFPFNIVPEFEEKCKILEQYFSPGRLLKSTTRKYTAFGFPDGAKRLWTEIAQNKTLDVPSYQEAMASLNCKKIKEQIIKSKEFEMGIQEISNVNSGDIERVIKRLKRFEEITLDKYNKDCSTYHPVGWNNNSEELRTYIIYKVRPVFHNELMELRATISRIDEEHYGALLGFAGKKTKDLVKDVMNDFDSKTSDAPTEYSDIVEVSKGALGKELELNFKIAKRSRKIKEGVDATIATAAAVGGSILGAALSLAILVVLPTLSIPGAIAFLASGGAAVMGATATASGIIQAGVSASEIDDEGKKRKQQYAKERAQKGDPK